MVYQNAVFGLVNFIFTWLACNLSTFLIKKVSLQASVHMKNSHSNPNIFTHKNSHRFYLFWFTRACFAQSIIIIPFHNSSFP